MYNHIRKIQELFSDTKNSLRLSSVPYSLVSFIEVMDGGHFPPCSVRYLYVIDRKEFLSQLECIPDMNFLYLANDEQDQLFEHESDREKYTVLTLYHADISMVISRLQDYFNETTGMCQWSDSLLSILFSEKGIQGLLDYAHTAFLNPILLFNPDFRLIGSTMHIDKDMGELGNRIYTNGGFSQEEFQIINKNNLHQHLLQNEFPILTYSEDAHCNLIISNIDSQSDMGHFVIVEKHRPLDEIDVRLAHSLKLALNQQLKKDEFIRNNRGFHHEYFLQDVLDGHISLGRHYQENYAYVNSEFSGTLYCMVIETARSSRVVNTMHIRALYEIKFPNAMTLMYNGAVVIVFTFDHEKQMAREDYQQIRSICEEYGLYAGISNAFEDIFDLNIYYRQALRSIELGIITQPDPSLFLYKQYYLNHMANVFCQKESADAFLHPEFKKLYKYDAAHHTSYCSTLYYYLISERNIAETARILYMHRNTLVYRLQKINELISVDYDSYSERQHLILSYEIIRNKSGLTPMHASSPESAQKKLPEKDVFDLILQAIRTTPEISQRLLSDRLHISYHQIRQHMNHMQEMGLIHREGDTRNGRWVISD